MEKDAAAAVPRFMRAMLRRNTDPERARETPSAEDSKYQMRNLSAGCLSVLLILVLDNHQRAVARASGLRSLRMLTEGLQTRSLVTDVLLPLAPALQTPWLVDRHVLTHLSTVGCDITQAVTVAFRSLMSRLLHIIREMCRSQGGRGEDVTKLIRPGGTAINNDMAEAQCSARTGNSSRLCDHRTLLVLLDILGLTIHPEDWSFMESADVVGAIALVAGLSAVQGEGTPEGGPPARATNCGGIIKAGDMKTKGSCDSYMQVHETPAKQPRLLATCHTAAWILLRALILQLHRVASTIGMGSVVGAASPEAESAPLASVLDVLRTDLNQCILRLKSEITCTLGKQERKPGRGGWVGSRPRDRKLSQAILDFAPPLIGGFSDLPHHTRVSCGGTAPGVAGSHKRRCQELVSSPRRLMNMDDGLMFSAEDVLSNPRSADFSITFWLLLLQDRTGHHRTVLARGCGSERWPVILLRNTDNRLEVDVLLRIHEARKL